MIIQKKEGLTMKKIRSFVSGKILSIRHRRDKAFFTTGLLAGGVVTAAVLLVLRKFKCKKCVRRMLLEKKQ